MSTNMARRTTGQIDASQKKYLNEYLEKSPEDLRFNVIEAGHSGLMVAGSLVIKEFHVKLYLDLPMRMVR
jgi:hypothetical protein